MDERTESTNAEPLPECFVLMPISDPTGYPDGHFRRVYDDIFVPACEMAGFRATRGDLSVGTHMIEIDILNRILSSPMALCDLSSRNPNVLFELGLRQAFDKPVALVQEEDTPRIFDIASLRYEKYRKARLYHEVLEDQKSIARLIAATARSAGNGTEINSIVRLLSATQAAILPEPSEADKDPVLQLVRAEISELRAEFRLVLRSINGTPSRRTRKVDDELEPANARAVIDSLLRSGIEQDVIKKVVTSSGVPDSWADKEIGKTLDRLAAEEIDLDDVPF